MDNCISPGVLSWPITTTSVNSYCSHSWVYRVQVDDTWVLVVAPTAATATMKVNEYLKRDDIEVAIPYALQGTYIIPESI